MSLREQQNPLAGAKGVPEEDRCPICRSTNKDGEPYEEFFTPAEQAALDAIGAANPNLIAMLPPKDARFLATKNGPATDSRRDQWHKKKTKEKKTNPDAAGEFHHPHPIGAGGCPFHQKVVKKPADPAEKAVVDSVDEQVKNIVDGAIIRKR